MSDQSASITESTGRRVKLSSELQSIQMDQYKEFCRLRDYRKPGVEVPHHTEAEAFALVVQSKAGHIEPAQRKKNPTTTGLK
ncbi:hypothetical protein P9875_09575 [Janthinobacterium rivuli]|uniref:Uncharacterized protein n=1 Tax=Janthinobacterium rivuli TaxID=2751478 RepID=A0ABY8IBQ8_9BURK|nr:hypothetical protein [Janthinobacterium rivuli]WFR81387.1 hypothetical protein P9875_09575 [Janthinobacterium rivuli]